MMADLPTLRTFEIYWVLNDARALLVFFLWSGFSIRLLADYWEPSLLLKVCPKTS